ncbi:MAG: hypothetical protein ACOCXZ_01995 [Chloroflexota bacterium]
MSGLFEKLNVLVKARLGSLIDDVPRFTTQSGRSDEGPVSTETLRERINKAISYEDELNRQIAAIENEIATLDRQADEAVERGNEAMARYLIGKMKRAEQRLAITRADLAQHQRIAQELILQVNQLEAAQADARYQDEPAEPAAQAAEQDESAAQQARTAAERFNTVMRDAQDRINTLGQRIAARRDQTAADIAAEDTAADRTTTVPDSAAVDDDLEARRNRLMKK